MPDAVHSYCMQLHSFCKNHLPLLHRALLTWIPGFDKIGEAYECFLKAVEKFPDAWELYIHGGEVCGKLEKYDEAIQYFDRAGAIGTPFYDELYFHQSRNLLSK